MVGPLNIKNDNITSRIDKFIDDITSFKINKLYTKNKDHSMWSRIKYIPYTFERRSLPSYSLNFSRDYSNSRITTINLDHEVIDTYLSNFTSMRDQSVYSNTQPIRHGLQRATELYHCMFFSKIYSNIIGITGKKLKTKKRTNYIKPIIEKSKRDINMLYKFLDDNKVMKNNSIKILSKLSIMKHINEYMKYICLLLYGHIYGRNFKNNKCIINDYFINKYFTKNDHNIYPSMDMHHTKLNRYSDELF